MPNFEFSTFIADILALACAVLGCQSRAGRGLHSTADKTGEGFPSHSVHLSLRIRPGIGVWGNLERYKLITGVQSCGVDSP